MQCAFGAPQGRARNSFNRQALMLGASALALSMFARADRAWAANECGAPVAGIVTCTGVFVPGLLQNGGIEYKPTSAFTLNLGNGAAPTSVTSQFNVIGGLGNGITVADLAGNFPIGGVAQDVTVNIRPLASISATNDGVLVWTDGAGNDAVVNNSGFITAGNFGINAIAGELGAPPGSGNAIVTNNGFIQSVNNSINAFSLNRDVQVTNNGTLISTNGNGVSTVDPLLGIAPTAGTVLVTNNGTITALNNGILAAGGGAVTVVNNATGTVNATNGSAVSVFTGTGSAVTNAGSLFSTNGGGVSIVGLPGAGSHQVDNSGRIGSLAAPVGGTGVSIAGVGDATVNNLAAGTIVSSGTGVQMLNTGTATLVNDGAITSIAGAGVNALSGGAGTFTNSGTINGQTGGVVVNSAAGATVANNLAGSILTQTGFGISANSLIDSSVTNAGLVTTLDGTAISALAGNNVTIGNSGAVTGSAGIFATAGNDLLLTSTPGSTVTATDGAGIVGLAGGNATLTTGIVTSNGGSGVFVGAAGNVDLTSNGKVSVTNGLFGVAGISTGGSATVNINADIDPPIIGGAAFTIGGGPATLNVAAGVSVEALTVGLLAGNIGTGAVTVNVGQDATIDAAFGGFGIGIAGLSVGTGPITIGTGLNSTVRADTFGIASLAIGTGSTNISIGEGAVVDAAFTGFGTGIAATSIGTGNIVIGTGLNSRVQGDTVGIGALAVGTGNVTIDVGENGQVLSNFGGIGLGIAAAAIGTGNVEINTGVGSSVIADTTAIAAVAVAGNVLINNSGLVQGNGVIAPSIFALSIGGTTINNAASGTIRGNLNQGFEPIIVSLGGPTTINNAGTMTGSVALLSGGNNLVSNIGLWNTAGLNVMGLGGDDTVNNTGVINTGIGLGVTAFFFDGGSDTLNNTGVINATGITAFIGLDNFNNAGGTLNSLNGVITDTTITTGNFNATGASRLLIDANLNGPAGPGVGADLLFVGNNLTGTTALTVNDLLAGQPGTFNPDGVVFGVVQGTTASNNFVLANGPIDKGLFSYDVFLRQDASGTDDWWVLASTPDATFFELPSIISAAQNLFHTSTGVWLDRTADLRAGVQDCVAGGMKDAVASCPPALRPGAWAKVFGSTGGREQDHSFTLHNRKLNFNVDYDQDTYGIVAGFDFARNADTAYGRGGWLFGLMGGYINSDQDFENSPTNVDIEAGLLGAYATYLNNGVFVDTQVAANLGEISYSSSAPALSANDSADLRSIGVVVDGGYRMPLNGSRLFIEPGATLAYVNTNIDNIKIFGTPIDFEDGDSLRGRLGLRTGTTFMMSGRKVEPFVGLSIWYEFEGDNKVNAKSGGFNLTAKDDVSGAFGEVAGGVNIFDLGSGMSGFAKGNYKFGENDYSDLSGQLGVRYQY